MPDGTIIVGDFCYRDLVRRRGAKAAEERWFGESAPFGVAAAAPGEAPVAIECLLAADESAAPAPATYRLAPDGGYLAPAGGPEALASVVGARVALHYDAQAFPFDRLRKREHYEDEALLPYDRARVLASGREAGLARAAAAAARTRVVDGVVWAPAPPPVLAVQAARGAVRVAHVCPAAWQGRWTPHFHVADVADALAHARWAIAAGHAQGEAVGAPAPARVLAPPDRDAFFAAEAERSAIRLAGRSWPGDFGALPLGMLEDWVSFRRHAAGLAAGRPEEARPAFEALGRLLDRTSEDPPKRGTPSNAEQDLRYFLEEPVRHWRAYLSGMGPSAGYAADAASIAGLAP